MDLLGACKGLGDLGVSGTEDIGSPAGRIVSTRVSGGACSRVSSRVSVDDCLHASMTSSSSTLIGTSLDLGNLTRFRRRSP